MRKHEALVWRSPYPNTDCKESDADTAQDVRPLAPTQADDARGRTPTGLTANTGTADGKNDPDVGTAAAHEAEPSTHAVSAGEVAVPCRKFKPRPKPPSSGPKPRAGKKGRLPKRPPPEPRKPDEGPARIRKQPARTVMAKPSRQTSSSLPTTKHPPVLLDPVMTAVMARQLQLRGRSPRVLFQRARIPYQQGRQAR